MMKCRLRVGIRSLVHELFQRPVGVAMLVLPMRFLHLPVVDDVLVLLPELV
jgi:hypothetical protein